MKLRELINFEDDNIDCNLSQKDLDTEVIAVLKIDVIDYYFIWFRNEIRTIFKLGSDLHFVTERYSNLEALLQYWQGFSQFRLLINGLEF